MSRKRILFIMSSLKFGGAEKQTVDLINRLDESKFDVFLCYLKREEELLAELQKEKLNKIECCDKKSKIELQVFLKIKKFVQEFEPEIVVCVDPYPGFYAYLLRMFTGLRFRLVQILHMTIIPSFYNEIIVRVLYRRMINRCDQVVFVCKNQMNHWINRYRIKEKICRVIYNGIDTNYFDLNLMREATNQLRESLKIESEKSVIGICAAMRPEKKITDFIDAGKILLQKGYSIKLLIIGSGPQRDFIEKRIMEKGMEHDVIITGFQHDVRPYLAVCDIVTITSVAVETFSVAVLEAMALEKAIVASDIGGASEQIINGEDGYLFPAGNVNALAECLEKIIIKNEYIDMGKQARTRVCNEFTVDRMVEGYQQLFLQ